MTTYTSETMTQKVDRLISTGALARVDVGLLHDVMDARARLARGGGWADEAELSACEAAAIRACGESL